MQVKDLNHKRVFDLSEDEKIAYIRRGDCLTTIQANDDGTLRYTLSRDGDKRPE